VNLRAVQLQPDDPQSAEAFAHLGMILWSTGETDAALKSLDKALFLRPDFPEALLYRGIILFAGVRDMKAAAEVFQRYLDVAPADANTARVKGMLEAARSNISTR
jgi:lipoprotein NlpI